MYRELRRLGGCDTPSKSFSETRGHREIDQERAIAAIVDELLYASPPLPRAPQ